MPRKVTSVGQFWRHAHRLRGGTAQHKGHDTRRGGQRGLQDLRSPSRGPHENGPLMPEMIQQGENIRHKAGEAVPRVPAFPRPQRPGDQRQSPRHTVPMLPCGAGGMWHCPCRLPGRRGQRGSGTPVPCHFVVHVKAIDESQSAPGCFPLTPWILPSHT